LLKYITIDKRIPQQSVDQIRQYVFDKMKETPGGKARLRTWADEADTRDKETRKNPRRFQDAVTAIDHPKPDPFKAFSRNITLDVFANQVLHMGVMENSNAKESVEALNELEKVLTQSTDLNDKDQARELRNALQNTLKQLEIQRASRMLHYITNRVHPEGENDAGLNIRDLVREQLFGEERIRWRLKELDQPIAAVDTEDEEGISEGE
jgi:hypothetical protein